jgi:hypothetical protein
MLEAYRDGVFSTATPRYAYQSDALEAYRDGALGAAVSHFGPSRSWSRRPKASLAARMARIDGLGAEETAPSLVGSGLGGFIGGFIGGTIGAAIGVWAVMRRRG